MSKPKATMSFKESRKVILDQMTSKAKGKVHDKVIRFGNEDVPQFLRNLDDFESKSRKTSVVVKQQKQFTFTLKTRKSASRYALFLYNETICTNYNDNKERLYWLIELSVPELFSANRRKVGEVLIRSDIKPSAKRDLNHFVMARLPGHFVLYERGGPSKPRYRFIPAGIKNHVPLFGT